MAMLNIYLGRVNSCVCVPHTLRSRQRTRLIRHTGQKSKRHFKTLTLAFLKISNVAKLETLHPATKPRVVMPLVR